MALSTFSVLTIVVCLCAASVQCQDDESSGSSGGMWSKLKKAVKEFVASIRSLWSEMKDEIKMRTTDMRVWSKEMFDGFKIKMKEWVDEMSSASQTEKEDMKKYIEKLQMPEGEDRE